MDKKSEHNGTHNLVTTKTKVTKKQRGEQKNQRPGIIWLTGISGAGKTTISVALDEILTKQNFHTYVLDGDDIRGGLNKDLNFSDESRHENVRRVGEVAKLLADAGLLVLVALISPFRADRQTVREIMPHGEFVEVYVKATIEECEKRDPKKFYAKARSGKIAKFTGITSIYEEPLNPELIVDTEQATPAESVQQLLNYLQENNFLQHTDKQNYKVSAL